MKLLLIFGLIPLSFAQIGQDTCDQQRFLSCTSNLGQFWNVDITNLWTDIGTFDRILMSLVKEPYVIDNYVNICNGFANFYSCLGPANLFNCLGIFGMVRLGNSPPLAYAYQGILADWGFKCGVGFYAVYESANFTACTQSTYVNYQQQMSALVNSYYLNTTADKDNVCTYAQYLMNDIGAIYETGPCRAVPNLGNRAYWYGCQSIREYTNAQFWHCFTITKCPIVAPSNEFELDGENFESENLEMGEKIFKKGYDEKIGDNLIHHGSQWV